MRDYVTCEECGAVIDSDFSIVRSVLGRNMYFCGERHFDSYMLRVIL
jgi:hypothetical protein